MDGNVVHILKMKQQYKFDVSINIIVFDLHQIKWLQINLAYFKNPRRRINILSEIGYIESKTNNYNIY